MSAAGMAVIVVLTAGALGCFATIRFVASSRMKSRTEVEIVPLRSPSSVHILRGGEELRDALSRAAHTERGIADSVRARADRYEALVVPSPVTEIRPERRLATPATIDQSLPA